jgi:hypothetical protein
MPIRREAATRAPINQDGSAVWFLMRRIARAAHSGCALSDLLPCGQGESIMQIQWHSLHTIANRICSAFHFPQASLKGIKGVGAEPRGACGSSSPWHFRAAAPFRSCISTYFRERFAALSFEILIARTFFMIRRNVCLSACDSPAMPQQDQTIYELSSEFQLG